MPRVLLHGHPETASIWKPLVGLLDAEPIVLGMPGYGTRRPDGFSATKEAYAEWLIAELEVLHEPVDLVGHDWGGILAVRVASLRPDLLRSWVSDALGVFDAEHRWHDLARVWQTPGNGEAFVEAALVSSDEDAIAAFGSGMPDTDAVDLRRQWDRAMWQCALSLYRSAVNISDEWGGEIEKAAAKPGLAILPRKDGFVDFAWAQRAAERADSRIATLDELGHWWFLQDPPLAARILEEFWNSIGGTHASAGLRTNVICRGIAGGHGTLAHGGVLAARWQ
jgi:pimeloyl-ACP methyl ester carboxylesterase